MRFEFTRDRHLIRMLLVFPFRINRCLQRSPYSEYTTFSRAFCVQNRILLIIIELLNMKNCKKRYDFWQNNGALLLYIEDDKSNDML